MDEVQRMVDSGLTEEEKLLPMEKVLDKKKRNNEGQIKTLVEGNKVKLERDEMMETLANISKVLNELGSGVQHHEFVNGQLDACLAILEADLKKKKKAREEATAEREKQLLE